MIETIYKPKLCAFHPKEHIFNFCTNPQCLLPLCPTCIKVHTEQHRHEHTYGQFQNMSKVVIDLNTFFNSAIKQLKSSNEDIKDQQHLRKKEQEQLKKRIIEAKHKMITLVDRFFTDFEKEVDKSINCYNDSMTTNINQLQNHISHLTTEIEQKSISLTNEKVLKTLIGFHARGQEKQYLDQIGDLQDKVEHMGTQKVSVVCQPSAIQSVIDELGNYIHLQFQNWQNEIKYACQFVKTGFTSTASDGFHQNRT